MKLTDIDIKFIEDHIGEDVAKLILSASKYPDLDIPFLADQIKSRQQIKEKLPSWYANNKLIFPARIAAEQCSSEQTALYKQRFVGADWNTCDLTGGLGIDSYFISRVAKHHDYIERFPLYCDVAQHNFDCLEASNVTVMNADSTTVADELGQYDLIYIDPARRGDCNKRVYALQDCEPNLPSLLSLLQTKSLRILAKLSPMADLQITLELLPDTASIHVLSVKNECKELLFLIEKESKPSSPKVVCVNFATDGEEIFEFSFAEEKGANVNYTSEVGTFLYEPNASVLKAGAFKQVGCRFGIDKLHPSSHLYTSEVLIKDFPGRKFEVLETIPFGGKQLKQLCKDIPKANITVRNFPLSVDELRKRLKISDGGDFYLFATTLNNGEKVIIKCIKA